MRVDQSRQQPSLGHRLRVRYRISRPPITIGVKINVLTTRQRTTANPNDHRSTPARKSRPSSRTQRRRQQEHPQFGRRARFDQIQLRAIDLDVWCSGDEVDPRFPCAAVDSSGMVLRRPPYLPGCPARRRSPVGVAFRRTVPLPDQLVTSPLVRRATSASAASGSAPRGAAASAVPRHWPLSNSPSS